MKRNLFTAGIVAIAVFVFGWGLFVMPANGALAGARARLAELQKQYAQDSRLLSDSSAAERQRLENARQLKLQGSDASQGLLESDLLRELQALEPKVHVLSLKFPTATYTAVTPPGPTPTPQATTSSRGSSAEGALSSISSDASVPQRAAPALSYRTGSLKLVGHYKDLLDALAALSTGELLVQVTSAVEIQPLVQRDSARDPLLTMTVPIALYRITPPSTPPPASTNLPSAVSTVRHDQGVSM